MFARAILTAIAVFGGAWLSRLLSPGESLSLIWLPGGIAFAMTWKYGLSMLWGTAAGLTLWSLLAYGFHPALVPTAALADVSAVIAGNAALRWLLARAVTSSSDPGGQPTRLRWLVCFYLAASFVSAPIAALVGAGGFLASGIHTELGVAQLFAAYWTLEALALMLIAPTILVWLGSHPSDAQPVPFGRSSHASDPQRTGVDRAVLILVVLLVALLLLLRAQGQAVLESALSLGYILVMALTALRHGARTTYTTLLVSALLLSTALSIEPTSLAIDSLASRAVPAAMFATLVLIFVTTVLTQILQAVSSDRAAAFRRLRDQSMHDATSGLLNEFGFDQWLAQAPKDQRLLVISAFFGRRARIDALTRQVPLTEIRAAIARRLRSLGALTVARLEGEHYALVFSAISEPSTLATEVAQSLRSMGVVNERGQRIMLHPTLAAVLLGPGVRPSCTQLVTTLTAIEVPTTDARSHELVVNDFSPELEDELRARSERLAAIEHWVRRGRIVLYGQPIIPASRAADGQVGLEVLCRMLSDDGTLHLPGSFLPGVEQLGLSRLLDRRVIETVFAWYARHEGAWSRTRKCAINLSSSSLEDATLPEFVADRLAKYALAPERFCFEITESNAVADSERARLVIEGLRRLGSRVAVDDFGAGFATFSYLRRFPVDELKIDGSFVESVATDPVSEAIVRSSVDVARRLGLTTVAEYVSSETVAERVTALGVDSLQGHAVAAAQPIECAYGLPEAPLPPVPERRRERRQTTP